MNNWAKESLKFHSLLVLKNHSMKWLVCSTAILWFAYFELFSFCAVFSLAERKAAHKRLNRHRHGSKTEDAKSQPSSAVAAAGAALLPPRPPSPIRSPQETWAAFKFWILKPSLPVSFYSRSEASGVREPPSLGQCGAKDGKPRIEFSHEVSMYHHHRNRFKKGGKSRRNAKGFGEESLSRMQFFERKEIQEEQRRVISGCRDRL